MRLKEPKPTIPGQLTHKYTQFGDLVCVDLFALSDRDGVVRSFVNAVDKASGDQVVSPVASKRPDEVFRIFNRSWIFPPGVPHRILADNGGEFNAEFGERCEELGATVLKTAAYAPTQNATCERRGGIWKVHAKAVMEETAMTLAQERDAEFLCAAINQAVNTSIDESGYSPSQWVLGKSLRLPYQTLSLSSRLAQAVGEDKGVDRRIAMKVAAERSITALKYSRRVAKAFSARSRADGSLPVEHLFQTGDQVYYWRGVTKAKSQYGRIVGWAQRS